MSKFNSSISILGITESKVQQAILKLLENTNYQKERLERVNNELKEKTRLLEQRIAQLEKVG